MRLGCVLTMPILAVTLASLGYSDELQRPDSGKKIKVFLFAGQSNMEGRASGRKLTGEDQTRVCDAQKRIQLAFNHEPIRPLDVATP
jgi:hypothetical protein